MHDNDPNVCETPTIAYGDLVHGPLFKLYRPSRRLTVGFPLLFAKKMDKMYVGTIKSDSRP